MLLILINAKWDILLFAYYLILWFIIISDKMVSEWWQLLFCHKLFLKFTLKYVFIVTVMSRYKHHNKPLFLSLLRHPVKTHRQKWLTCLPLAPLEQMAEHSSSPSLTSHITVNFEGHKNITIQLKKEPCIRYMIEWLNVDRQTE